MTAQHDRDLFAALKARDYSAMMKALSDGANVNLREDETGRTPLHYATIADGTAFARGRFVGELLAKGARTDISDAKDQTPLHLAAQRADIAIIDALLEKAADINAQDWRGRTPLHMAMETALGTGRTQGMQHLIEKGANSLVRDVEEKTALDRAREREGFSNFYATVIGFLSDWERDKPEERRRADIAGANKEALNQSARDAIDRMRADSKRFKLKPDTPKT